MPVADYLQRYLPKEAVKKKKGDGLKKKKKSKPNAGSFRIVDLDAPVPDAGSSSEDERFQTKEEAPQVEENASEPAGFANNFKAVGWQPADDQDAQETATRTRYDSESDEDQAQPSTSTVKLELKTSDSSKPSKRLKQDRDLSPPRKKSRGKTENSGEGAGDPSAPRKSADSETDLSPPRRARMDSDDDLDVKRKSKVSDDSDLDVPRRSRRSPSGDLSPPRKSKPTSRTEPDLNVRRRKRSSSGDLSPPRKARSAESRNESDSNVRRRKPSSSGDLSPPRKTRSTDSDHDELPRRNRTDLGSSKDRDSPQQTQRMNEHGVVERKSYQKSKKKNQPTEEQLKFQKVMEERYALWGKGTTQLANQKDRVAAAIQDADAPLARFSDDERMNASLKEKEYEEDPMASYFQKKKRKTDKAAYPVYSGPPPPENRFGLRPGYRWDGVDRSTGFEAKLLAVSSKKKADNEEYHKWAYGAD